MATPQDLLAALARAYALTESRFSGDPEYVRAIEGVREVHGQAGWVTLQIRDDRFISGGQTLSSATAAVEKFRNALSEAGIWELRLQEVQDAKALEEFFVRLHPSRALDGALPSARFRVLEGTIGFSFRRVEGPLPGMAGGVRELFRRGWVGPEIPSEAMGAGSPELDATPVAEPSPQSTLPTNLVEEVRTYLGSYDLLRTESERRIREWAAGFRESRTSAALGALVQLLAESGGADPPDQEAIDLARELVTPAAASNIVARLTTARDEYRRAHLSKIISRIGPEGALALADALGEARDRSERRAFLDALVALGPMGLEMAKKMVEDPRWFVVRNGVMVLGELGNEEAVSHLTGTLASGDGRVRKETILGLAKIGGENAEMLILGMLDDAEADVRGAACRALGALGSGRAAKPLLGLLKDPDPDVVVSALQALGRIGDPGTVQQVERKALGGFFTRPPREIRIAAFRALAGLGTPRALRALEKGAKDQDERVREVAEGLKK